MLGWFLISEVTKFPREKQAADQINTNTCGQIGTTQLFNILLDILLAYHSYVAYAHSSRLDRSFAILHARSTARESR